MTFRSQLAAFDSAWCIYLNSFVVWKVRDAETLEQDLVRDACQLELSMIQKCKLNAEGECADLTKDLKDIQKQVVDDQNLLREKVLHLSGVVGIRRLDQGIKLSLILDHSISKRRKREAHQAHHQHLLFYQLRLFLHSPLHLIQ